MSIAKSKLIALINILLITIPFLAINQLQQRVEAFSYPVDWGPKWRNEVASNLKVWFNTTLDPEHRRHFLRAIGFWNSIGTLVTFRIVNTGGDIIVTPDTRRDPPPPCGGGTVDFSDSSNYIYYSRIVVHPNPACLSDRRQWVAVATHELGHALGLGHMKYEPYSIMGGAWDYYRLPIPLLDDILPLLYLYGLKKPNPVKFFTGSGGYHTSRGPAELNGYPYQLYSSPSFGFYPYYVFASLTYTLITLNLYGSLGAMILPNMKYIRNEIHHGEIGFYTSTNPAITESKVFELSIDGSVGSNANFYLTYRNSSSNYSFIRFASETFDASNDAAYLVILAVFHWEDGYTYALAIACELLHD